MRITKIFSSVIFTLAIMVVADIAAAQQCVYNGGGYVLRVR